MLAATSLIISCCAAPGTDGASADALAVLEATRSKMLETPTHHYRFRSFWDNRFAASTYQDSMDITYSYLPESDLGFGFHAAGLKYEILYDGKDKLMINHTKRKIIRTTAAEIGKDSAYFQHSMSFHCDPKALPEFDALTLFSDTLISGKKTYLYAITTYSPSSEDSTKDIVSTTEYYLNPKLELVDRMRTITHIERDTIQTIEFVFTGYAFGDEAYTFGESDREKSLGYREISKADDKKERLAGLVRPGEQLHRADYTDINDKEQLLYGKAGTKTLVMFSFIGCGGCEYALREMKKKDFAVRDGIALMYSSPVNEASTLPTYFKKKEFPFVGFGKESLMNENFNVASFPTFVLINEDGGVARVMGGYDQEVADVLFE